MPRTLRTTQLPAAATLLVAFACAILALTPAHARAADAPIKGAPFSYGQSGRYTLGGTWFLKRDPANAGLRQRFGKTRDFSSWQPVTVPNAFNAGDASEGSYTGSVAWYGTEFTRPATPRNNRWILQFNSVNYKATVFLNGKEIGSHAGGYIPFEVLASSMRKGVNRLVVRVDARLTENSIPSQELRNDTLTGGWWNYGGILREVVLRRVGNVDLKTVATRSNFKSTRGPAKITVLAQVKNYSKRKKTRLRLTGRFGSAAIRFRPTVMRKGKSATLIGTAVVRKPKLWSFLSPNLYKVTVRAPGINWTAKAGVRKLVRSSNGSISLNGKKIRTRGISFHEADDKVGAAWTPAVRAANLGLIERIGANFIRSHYPLAPQEMEWADAHGILVWVQAPVYRPRETQLKSKTYRRNAVSYVRQMVAANRMYTSVGVWSLMNEAVPSGTTNLNLTLSAELSAGKKLDNGLFGADYAAAPEDELQHPAYRKLDVLGVNEYFGWYPGLLGSTIDMNLLRPYLDYLHGVYAHQALFVTEFGAEANRDGSADELGTYAFQSNFMQAQMRILRDIPYLNGYFAWALKDYWVRPDWGGGNPDPSPPYSNKGLFDTNGNPKPAEAFVEREFKATPPFK